MVKINEAYEYICVSIPVGQELLIANSNANAFGEKAKSSGYVCKIVVERVMRNKYTSIDTN